MGILDTAKRIQAELEGQLNQPQPQPTQSPARLLPLPDMDTQGSTPQFSQGGPDLFIGNLPKAVIQGTARGAFAVGNILAGAFLGMSPDEVNKYSFTPEGGARLWLGDEPVGLSSEGTSILTKIGFSERSASSLAPGILVALTALDGFTGGSSKGVITALKNADNALDAGKVLRSAGVTEDLVEEYASVFAKTKTLKETTEAFESLYKLQTTTRKVETTPLSTFDGTDPITVKGGQAFSEVVDNGRRQVSDLFKKAGDSDLPAWSAVKGRFTEGEAPTLRDFNNAAVLLKSSGQEVKGIETVVADIRATMKVEPERFAVQRDALVTAETPISLKIDEPTLNKPGIFSKEERPVLIEAVKTKENATVLRERYVDRLVDVSEEIAQQGGKMKAPTRLIVEKGDLENGIKAFDNIAKELPAAAPKLDEVANPLKENLGMLSVNVQARYGKAAVTKAKVEKFRAAENKVLFQLVRYSEEAAYVAENGGSMVQKIPSWVPENLRSMTLFDSVSGMIRAGDMPTVHGTPEMDLYIAMIDETARRAGIKNAPRSVPNPEQVILQSFRRDIDSSASMIPQEPQRVVLPKDELMAFDKPELKEAEYEAAVKEYNQSQWPTYSKSKNKNQKTAPQTFLDDLEKTVVGEEKFNPKDIFATAQGKHTDVFRLNKKVWGPHWEKVKAAIFDPFDAAKGRMVENRKMLRDELHSEVVKAGIKRKSKESAAIMKYGEGKLTYEDLVKQFGNEKAGVIVNHTKWFRAKYDQLIDELNVVEKAIYPNRPEKITPKRPDYFRHMQEQSELMSGLRNLFESTAVRGTADDFFAKQKWASIRQIRKGDKTVYDAVGGMLDYIEQFSYAKHIDPEAARIGDIVKEMQVRYKEQLPNYLDNMNLFIRDLNGFATGFDVFFEKYGLTRASLDFVDAVNKRAKRNAVLGNFSSALSQVLAVPFVAGSAKQHTFKGMLRTVGDFAPAGFRQKSGMKAAWEKSTYIAERYKDKGESRFNVGILENAQDMAGWMISVLDEVSVKFSFNSHYEQALKRGIPDPVKYADDQARRISGGRGVGEVPLIHKAKINQIVIPFQYEVANQWFLLKDMISEKDFMGLMAFSFASYALYEGVEEVTGAEVGINPLEMLHDSYKIATEPTYDEEGVLDDKSDKAKKVGARVAGEVLTNMPLGGYVAAGAVKMLGMTEDEKKNYFGDEDPLRFSNAPLLWNSIYNEDNPYISLYRLLPAWGGRQIEKTIGGLTALTTGVVTDHSGTPMYDVPVEPGVAGAMRNVLFGKFAPNFEYKEDLEKEMEALNSDIQVLLAAGDTTGAKKLLAVLNEKTAPVYKKVAGQKKEERKAQQIDRAKKVVYTINGLKAGGKIDEAKAVLQGLSKEEFVMVGEAQKAIKSENYKFAEEVEKDPESWIRGAIDFAYAFGTNPKQAWDLMSQGETIETTVGGSFGGMVTARRIPKKESEAIKKDLGHKKGDGKILEHKLPLTLGGSNQLSNLELVDGDRHDSWTRMEKLLGDAVKAKKIDYQGAQELILRFKGYEGESISPDEIYGIIGTKSVSRDDWHRGIDDWGRNSWLLSDQDYSERSDDNGRKQGKRTIVDVYKDKSLSRE